MKQHADLPRVTRGFTLIETRVVVAVLAVIAVMTTPSFVAWHARDGVPGRRGTALPCLRASLPHRAWPTGRAVGQ